MLVLSKLDIYKSLVWKEAIQASQAGFKALSTGRGKIPLRFGLEMTQQQGLLLIMPGSLSSETGSGQLAVKIVSVFNQNPARGLPLIYGLVTLFDAATGQPLAVMEGASLTAIRTGAASGVATNCLAAPQACRLAIFGAGTQAYTQLKAIATVRELIEVRIVGRDPARANAFVERVAAELDCKVKLASTAQEALEGADIVVTATTSPAPLFHDQHLMPGTHINGVGSYLPTLREVPAATVGRARLVVDEREAALNEAGDIIIPMAAGDFGKEHIYAELGEIVAGLKPGRASFETGEISFFKSVGNASQDVAMGYYIYQKARELGIGTEVSL